MIRGQTYEPGDPLEIPSVDDRIADLAQILCDDYRRVLDMFCCDPQRAAPLLAMEDALRERRKGNAEVIGLAAASLPQGPCGLPGYAGDNNGER